MNDIRTGNLTYLVILIPLLYAKVLFIIFRLSFSSNRDSNDSWGSRGSNWSDRRGGGGRDEERGPPRSNNDRWQMPRENDWTTPLARDESEEVELFGTGNTGINFNKYEDIPVDATGKDVPNHIDSVS